MNTNIPSVFAAEAVALQALNLGLQLGLREVEVEVDSWSVIRKLQEKMNDRLEISVYFNDALQLNLRFSLFVFVFTNREANKVAHLLASERIKKGESTYLSNLVPFGVVEAVAEDRQWIEEARKSRERGNEEIKN
ncbi:uncharacterized protein [Gossypium hirsutum]|uniref:RNase H type-1 domain-containing protein n=1 Tax=Gossypium hirsutum TaxID=3635 RepID=A0ABM2YYK1_GOSHI|nr:uncharacterized protein LOC107934615 [Gossypium hirsutum]